MAKTSQIVKQEKAEMENEFNKQAEMAKEVKKEVNKKRTRDDEDTQLFDDEDTLPWMMDAFSLSFRPSSRLRFNNWAYPMIAFRGVRNSWLIFARKRLLA